MKKSKIWTFATLWLMEECHVVDGGRRRFFFFADRHRWQPIVLAARAGERFPEVLDSAIGRSRETYRRESQTQDLTTALGGVS
jgi:hypothetical protein